MHSFSPTTQHFVTCKKIENIFFYIQFEKKLTSLLSTPLPTHFLNFLGSPARIFWAPNCDFDGQDLYPVQAPGEECGNICRKENSCSHFSWNDYNGGTCWLKVKVYTYAFFVSSSSAKYHSCAVMLHAACGLLQEEVPGEYGALPVLKGGVEMDGEIGWTNTENIYHDNFSPSNIPLHLDPCFSPK